MTFNQISDNFFGRIVLLIKLHFLMLNTIFNLDYRENNLCEKNSAKAALFSAKYYRRCKSLPGERGRVVASFQKCLYAYAGLHSLKSNTENLQARADHLVRLKK